MGTSQPTVVSLFTGLGGLDLGLEAAGLRTIGCVEIDDSARRSLKVNRPDIWPILDPNDVRDFAKQVDPTVLGLRPGDLDVVAAAPPCQPFSKAAQWSSTSRRGLRDERGNLIFSVLDVVTRLRPKIVVLENVRGFVEGSQSVLPWLRFSLSELNRELEEHRALLERAPVVLPAPANLCFGCT